MTEISEYGLADKAAFDTALRDNTPYNHEFYTKNRACLLNFVSYYESCKQLYQPTSCALSCIETAVKGVEE